MGVLHRGGGIKILFIMKIFDTHCHPNLNIEKDADEIINNFFENWWTYLNIIWTDLLRSNKSVELANKYKWAYASIWIHPCDIIWIDLEWAIEELEELYNNNREKVIAIGECWLDYYWLEKELNENLNVISEFKKEILIKNFNLQKKNQELFFKAQIKLARKLNLPIVIHNRSSKEDILRILEETNFKNFVFHCFTENYEYAERLINFSSLCKISFSWIVTFKNAKEIQETAEKIPLKYILAETDSPYLTPTPYRWKEENEPIYTRYVVEKISELKWVDCSEQIFKNSLEFFWIKKD